MYTIEFVASCPERQSEVDPKSLDAAACLIEESVSLLFVQLFGSVFVEKVSVSFMPLEQARGDLLSPTA